MYPIYFILLVSLFAKVHGVELVVRRIIDISTQLVVVNNDITVDNQEQVTTNEFVFITEPNLIGSLVHIEARGELPLNISKTETSWKVGLNKDLHPGEQTRLFINCVYINSLVPHPGRIKQGDPQLVIFRGNVFFYTPYFVRNQYTVVRLPSTEVESYTRFEPVNQNEIYLAYGTYPKVAALSFQELKIHYKNNAPFLVVNNLKHVIKVSHWGNVAVEDFIELEHRGALLKGPFSRLDYQSMKRRQMPSIQQYVTTLPASAKDIYYRDLLGNISSSRVKYLSDAVHLHLKLRYPLFGGWKINYFVGYNLPSYDVLFSKGNNFLLRMNIMDQIFKNMVVEKMQTLIILPEHSFGIEIDTKCAIGNLTFGKHFTFDVVGHPTVSFTGYNLVANHIGSFDVQYMFPYWAMLLKPLYLCFIIFILFAAYIFLTSEIQ